MPRIARLSHPLHGEKDAYTPAEVEDDKKNGWKVVTDDGASEAPVPSFFSVSTEAELTEQVKEEQAKLDALKHQVKGEQTRLNNLKAQVKEEQAKLDALKSQQPPVTPPPGPNLGNVVNALTNQQGT